MKTLRAWRTWPWRRIAYWVVAILLILRLYDVHDRLNNAKYELDRIQDKIYELQGVVERIKP